MTCCAYHEVYMRCNMLRALGTHITVRAGNEPSQLSIKKQFEAVQLPPALTACNERRILMHDTIYGQLLTLMVLLTMSSRQESWASH